MNHSIMISRDVVNEVWDWNKKERNFNPVVPAIFDEEQVQQEVDTQEEPPKAANQNIKLSQRQQFVSSRLADHDLIMK